ncbi:hypothetical protein J2Y45_003663 [Dyadobacter sp. BE34]|uniref:Secreted protein n=1 Tax=Dyadobacter fermentans TaxID=94254 RepID=A0ABU1QZ85_9BACT|nr:MULTISPECIES: hypothetical protein [Dyadobacter]MDR6806471.1 hypothetical protein [Dyadobacter fermentans]MDR7044212.1 hypothetical protein [Dyadobacter sp. BE242]MDR7198523.1 hypothetical protein [Dyadobacter sp. BE34]MDR7216485.1 hypothetical protein [Dyadobacter sp. BE31]MDR7263989.1 hypothetical protein [Dyadobacter sp. BE32]
MEKIGLCLIITLLSSGLSAQTPLQWNYPCKPGTECWNALTSVEERQIACQITGLDLKTLTTEELLLITMEHPFFRSYVAHDSPLEGLGFALEGFNGFEEFRKRPDAMKAACNVYFREDFSRIKAMADSAEMGAYSLKWIGVELIMCDDALLSQMSSQEKIDFLKRLHAQLRIKQRYRDVFGGISDAVSAYIFDKVMHSMGDRVLESHYEAERMKGFRERLILRDPRQIELLLDKFTEYVKNH